MTRPKKKTAAKKSAAPPAKTPKNNEWEVVFKRDLLAGLQYTLDRTLRLRVEGGYLYRHIHLEAVDSETRVHVETMEFVPDEGAYYL